MPSLSPLSSLDYSYTWSYENRVSKHFSQLPLSNSLFAVLFAYVVFFCFVLFFFSPVLWLGICVQVDVDRIAILRHFKFGVVGMLLGTINLLPGVR